MGIHYSHKEYREIKKDNPDLTWEKYQEFKQWIAKNYDPEADKAFNTLLKLMEGQDLTFDVCHKIGEENGKPYPHFRVNIEGARGTFWLCTYCGYLCEVQDNRYNYHIVLPGYTGDLKYDIDSRGQVIVHPPQ